MNEPIVSVLMTVFNAGRFLDPSIRSILNQTFRDFEFLIIDDASTDGSAEIAEAWAGKDPRVRFIRNADNKGQTTCLNQGLLLARGRWVARQDADDLAHPSRLAKQHQFTTIRPEIVLLGSNGRIIDEHDRLAGLLDAPLSQQAITWTSPFLNPFMHTSVMFRTTSSATSLLVQRSLPDRAGLRALDARHCRTRGANLPERLVCYRHLTTSLSKSRKNVAFAEAAQVSEREARRVFGRNLSEREAGLIASFREGLTLATGGRSGSSTQIVSNRTARAGDLPAQSPCTT